MFKVLGDYSEEKGEKEEKIKKNLSKNFENNKKSRINISFLWCNLFHCYKVKRNSKLTKKNR